MTAKPSTHRRGNKGNVGMMTAGGSAQAKTPSKKHVMGTTREGIQILKPRGNPSSFTWQELREAMPTPGEKTPA